MLTIISSGVWTWTAYPSTGIHGHNIERFDPGKSIEQCKGICQMTPGCYGFDYPSQSVGSCFTSSLAGNMIKFNMGNHFLLVYWHLNSVQQNFICIKLLVRFCTVFSINLYTIFLSFVLSRLYYTSVQSVTTQKVSLIYALNTMGFNDDPYDIHFLMLKYSV